MFDRHIKKTIGVVPVPFAHRYTANVEAHVHDVDVAYQAQRNRQRMVQDGPIPVRPVDIGEDLLDACTLAGRCAKPHR
jgi:hypothetical protein